MSDSMPTADEVRSACFTPVRIREGYDMGAVDDFLDRLAQTRDRGEDVGPLVSGARFPVVRMREGYAIEEIDAFLDRFAADRPASRRAGPSVPGAAGGDGVVVEQRGILSRLFGRRRA